MPGMLLEHRAVARHAHLVGRVTGHAVDGDDLAFTVEGLNQPFGAGSTPCGLVYADIDRVGRRHFGVSRDHQDPGFLGLREHRIEGCRAVGVDDDGVDALADEVANMGNLAGHVDIGALHHDFDIVASLGPGRSGGLRLVDHLGAPLGADPAVGQADLEVVGENRRSGDGGGGDAGERNKCKLFHRIPPLVKANRPTLERK